MSAPPATIPGAGSTVSTVSTVAGRRPARRRLAVAAGIALLAGVGVARTRFEPILVAGQSMEPTLHSGDLLLLDRRAFAATPPARNDLVIVRHRGGRIVKRIVGLPGERIEVRKSRLFVNDQPTRAEHGILPGYLDIGRGQLLSGRYAVLGDNRSLTPEETNSLRVFLDATRSVGLKETPCS